MTATPKTKFPRAQALDVARQIAVRLDRVCERIEIAGSIRRQRPEVGDIELLYVPSISIMRGGLFGDFTTNTDLAAREIDSMVDAGVIAPRPNKRGQTSWGDSNKLALHCASGIPIDFFATTISNWWNYLVCRTGGAETNKRIAAAAKSRGWQWHPYSAGFTNPAGRTVPAHNEEDVFRLAEIEFIAPENRP